MFPVVSATVWTCAEVSFHVTTTTFRSPATWAELYGPVTVLDDVVSTVRVLWTKRMPGVWDCASPTAIAPTAAAQTKRRRARLTNV